MENKANGWPFEVTEANIKELKFINKKVHTLNIAEAKALLKKDLEQDYKISKDERSLISKIAHFRAKYMCGILKLLEKPNDTLSLLKNRKASKVNLVFAMKIFRNSDTEFPDAEMWIDELCDDSKWQKSRRFSPFFDLYLGNGQI